MNTKDVIDNMLNCSSGIELFCCFEGAMNSLGFDRILLALMNDHPRLNQKAQHGILRNYPDEWLQHYFANNYDRIDPVRKQATQQMAPFTWQSLMQAPSLTITQKTMFNQAHEAGLYHGLGVPLYGPGGTNAGIGLASSRTDTEISPEITHRIHTLSMQFYACFWQLHEQPERALNRPELSAREIEVLRWLAQGLTKIDIGDKLKISTHTVDFHTRSIMAKLGTRNIASTIFFAMRLGLIALD